MDTAHALVYYRKNYLVGVARPGALSFDGSILTLHANDLTTVWSAPLTDISVKKGMGILTVSINGAKTSILTAIGGKTSPSPSRELQGWLESSKGLIDAPSVNAAAVASWVGVSGVGVYASGQKSLREFFTALGVMA